MTDGTMTDGTRCGGRAHGTRQDGTDLRTFCPNVVEVKTICGHSPILVPVSMGTQAYGHSRADRPAMPQRPFFEENP